MIKANSTKPVWGLSLGSTSWAAECVDGNSGELIRQSIPGSKYSTPSILLPRLSGEPTRLDTWTPIHVRGSGTSWPLEGVVDGVVGSGRMPVAAAWTARSQAFLSHDQSVPVWRWSFDGVSHELRPIDCLADAIAQLGSWVGKKSPIAITIPNNFRQLEQQLVIDRCRASDVDVTLLWRPIAGALAWLDQFESTLGKLPESKRNLLDVHADWGTITFTEIRIVSGHESSSRKWLPARSRPQGNDVTPGFGWAVEAISRKLLSLTQRWSRFMDGGGVDDLRSCSQLDGSTLLDSIQQWETAFVSPIEPFNSFKERLIRESARYAGVVITGDFAGFALDGNTTLSIILDIFAPKIARTSIVASGIEGEKLLAKGAAIFANERQKDIVSYLDTLPELDLFVETSGQFDWLPLLSGKDRFVPGGQKWQRPDPIRGLAVRRGATAVRLVVAHEEFNGVREIAAMLSETAEQRLSAELHVSAIAAQGNAALRLDLADESQSRPMGKIHADWRRMKPILDKNGQPIDKNSYLKMQPRAFPELMPRKSSYSCWNRSQSQISEFIRRLPASNKLVSDTNFLRSLNQAVQQKDQTQYPNDATAIGSDFHCPGTKRILDEFVDGLLQLWRKNKSRPNDGFVIVVRILGYLSVDSLEFENWLIKNICSSFPDRGSVKHSFGLCARDSGNIAKFLSAVFASRDVGTTDLKSASQILRYRAKATEAMTSELCENVFRVSLRVFEREMANGGRSFAFRWSSLIVVYILRRRMFDSGFAEPEDKLAQHAKVLFSTAIRHSKSGKLHPIGGSVDLPAALQQVIDYIDKKGRGDILMAVENQ